LLANSTIHLARLERARGNPEKAQEAIRSVELLISERRLSPRQSRLTSIASARWWMDQGYPGKASQLLQQLGVTSDEITKTSHKEGYEIPYWREPENMLLVRLLLAEGKQDAALSLCERLLQNAEAAKRLGRVIEINILQALAWQGKKNLKRAVETLDKALTLSRPAGYTRVFLDEGEPMAKLLYQAKTHWSGNETISELLAAMKNDRSNGQSPAQLLIEPITLRELEVIKLIEAGCTNQEIANRLVISIPTVKRHISNIYTKLGAKSRTQAVSLAKELRLFD
jgi:LuxR family maltose regulon positive regulatory protein